MTALAAFLTALAAFLHGCLWLLSCMPAFMHAYSPECRGASALCLHCTITALGYGAIMFRTLPASEQCAHCLGPSGKPATSKHCLCAAELDSACRAGWHIWHAHAHAMAMIQRYSGTAALAIQRYSSPCRQPLLLASPDTAACKEAECME
jgi:hypothetical protein